MAEQSSRPGRLAGKAAFITGAGQGLGAAFARMLADEGARVTLTDRSGEAVEAEAEKINARHPGRARAIALDVTDTPAWEPALRTAEAAMGGISILINNAGIGPISNIETETPENWRAVHAVNVDAVVFGTQAALPFLTRSQPASIINIASVAGLIASPHSLAYNASKAAVGMVTKSTALHLAKSKLDIRCNSVHPVFTRTAIIDPVIALGGGGAVGEQKLVRNIPMKRLGEPEDIGYAVLYLASDESRFVTGTELVIDGGMTAGR